jgi:hypothetical protein
MICLKDIKNARVFRLTKKIIEEFIRSGEQGDIEGLLNSKGYCSPAYPVFKGQSTSSE